MLKGQQVIAQLRVGLVDDLVDHVMWHGPQDVPLSEVGAQDLVVLGDGVELQEHDGQRQWHQMLLHLRGRQCGW